MQFKTAREFIEEFERQPYGSKPNTLDAIRSLPRPEANILLNALCYKVDGDQGYGQWPNLDYPWDGSDDDS